MSQIPDHLKNPHLSAWSLGLTVTGCCLSIFSPIAINKYPQWSLLGTATGGVLSGVGWVMSIQSEKSSKLQAKLEEQAEAVFLRRLGMEQQLEKIRDAVYLEESQRAIIQQPRPQISQQPMQHHEPLEEQEQPRGSLIVLEKEDIPPIVSIPRPTHSPTESVLNRGYFESLEELKTVIWLEENAWFKACLLNKLLMMVGDQGSGKTTLAQFILGCRILLKGHFIYVADPHAEKNGWNNYADVVGHKKDWSAVENRVDKYFEIVTNTLPGDERQYSFLFDEMTQYKDCLNDSNKAALMLKSWCSDVRKSAASIVCLTHNDTCEALAGVKGMKDSINSSFLRLYLANKSDPETGEFKPAHQGYIENFKKDARNQSISTQIKTQVWMQFKFIQPLFDKLIPSDPVTVESVTIPEIIQSIDPLDISTWQQCDYPSGLQWLPQYEPGVYAAIIEGQPLYIGQSGDLWRRWNVTGSHAHHVKPHLDNAVGKGLKAAIAFCITPGWDEQKRLALESELQNKYKSPWNGTSDKSIPEKPLSEVAQAVWDYICTFEPEQAISARDCYRKSSLRTQYNLDAETTEQVFDELQKLGLGEKMIRDVNGFRSVSFVPKN